MDAMSKLMKYRSALKGTTVLDTDQMDSLISPIQGAASALPAWVMRPINETKGEYLWNLRIKSSS
jgi:hypothetical protein